MQPINAGELLDLLLQLLRSLSLSLSLGGTLWPLAAGHSSQVWQFNPHQNPKHKRSSEMRRLRASICCMRGKSDSKTSDSPVTTNT